MHTSYVCNAATSVRVFRFFRCYSWRFHSCKVWHCITS